MFPDTPPCLGHLCMGMGKPGPPTLPSCQSLSHPQGHLPGCWCVLCHPAVCSPQIPPERPGAASTRTDTDEEAHTHEAFPASLVGKLMGLVWLCLGGDGKPIPAKQAFYYRLFWVFFPVSSV